MSDESAPNLTPAFICKTTTSKAINYVNNLEKIENKSVADFALYTPINSIQRFLVRYELMKMIEGIPGAIIEMGVCSGNGLMSLIHCHNVLQPTYRYREFYGFDTFEGFPSIDVKDGNDVMIKVGGHGLTENYIDYLKNVMDYHELNSPISHIKKYELINI